MHILTTLNHYRTEAKFNKPQSRKKSAGSSADHYDLRTAGHIRVVNMLIGIILRHLIDIDTHFQIDKDGALTGINTPSEHPHMIYCAHIKAFLISNKTLQILFVCSYLRQYPEL